MLSKRFGKAGKVGIHQRNFSPASHQAHSRRFRPLLEVLESRFAPTCSVTTSGGVLMTNCTGGPDTVTVNHDNNSCAIFFFGAADITHGATTDRVCDILYSSIQINGGSNGLTTNILANVHPLTVFDNHFSDAVNVGNTSNLLVGIGAPVLVENEPSESVVNIHDEGDTAAHTATVSTVTRSGDTSLGQLAGVSPGVIQWDYFDTSVGAKINLGSGTSTVNVQGVGVPTTVFNHATATVNVGLSNSISGMLSTLLLENEPSFDTVNVNDSADTAAHTATVSTATRSGDTSLGQLAGVSTGVIQWDYSDTSQANLNLGSGTSTVNVQGVGVPTTIFNQAGATVNVGLSNSISGIQSTLLLENEPSFDTVNVNDSADTAAHTATISTVTRSGDTSLGALSGVSGVIQWDSFDTTHANLNLGSATSTVNVQGVAVPTTIFNQAAATVNVGLSNSISGILATLLLENEPSFDTVNVNDSADSTAHTATISTVTRSGETSLGQLAGVSPGVIQWDYFDTAQANLNLGSGTSTVNVQGVGVPTTIFNQAAATVNVGLSNSISGILATLLLENEPSFDTVNVNDSADSTAHTATVSTVTRSGDTSLGQLAGVSPGNIRWDYFDTNTVTVNLGSGTSTVNILGVGVPTTINNNGAATVNVGNAGSLAGIIVPLTLFNGPNFDALTIDDSADPSTLSNVVVSASGITGLAPGALNFTSFSISTLSILGGTGANTYNLTGSPYVTSMTLSTGPGDTVNIGSAASTLDPIGNVTINGTGTVNLNDSGFGGSEDYSITANTVTISRSTFFALTYNGSAALNLNAGPGSDIFDIDSSSAVTTINAGGGGNSFHIGGTLSGGTQFVAASILGPLFLNGGGGDVLDFFDANDPASETFSFDAVPSTLTLGSTGTTIATFSGMGGGIFVMTNGFSTANDLSGTVIFDPAGGPPSSPGGGSRRPIQFGFVHSPVNPVYDVPKIDPLPRNIPSAPASVPARSIIKSLDQLALVDEVFALFS